jgi:predicted acetyltransferase
MLLARSKEAIRSLRDSVPLTEIFEIEDSNVDQLIHETQRNRMYPETEQEQAERNKVIEEHNEKVLGYLHQMQKTLNEQAFGCSA